MGQMTKAKDKLETYGPEYLLGAISARLPEWLLSYYHTVLISTRSPRLVTRAYKDYLIRPATMDDINNLNTVDIVPSKARERLARGDTCFIVEKAGRVVAISWGAKGKMWVRYGGQVVDTGEDGFFLYGVYVIPEERMKGLIGPLFKLQFEHFGRDNRNHALGAVDIFNKPSIMLHRRMGFDIVGETYCITLLGLSCCYYKQWPDKTKKFHFFFKRPPDDLPWV
jgi:hypothetical protein